MSMNKMLAPVLALSLLGAPLLTSAAEAQVTTSPTLTGGTLYQTPYGSAYRGSRVQGFQGANGRSGVVTPRFRAVNGPNGAYVNGINRDFGYNKNTGAYGYQGRYHSTSSAYEDD
ncbi:MAG: hypothetical protein H7Y37_18575 [Anaerolineae bacterium]|nr:hypothetical protein [Gloeobacterales cyanobacterium ES-bin-313]